MSAEEIIRSKHRVENALMDLRTSLSRWNKGIALLTTQELELLTAKALDAAAENPDDRPKKFKLLALSACLKRRVAGYHVSKLKRFWLTPGSPEVLMEEVMAQDFQLPDAVGDEVLVALIEHALT